MKALVFSIKRLIKILIGIALAFAVSIFGKAPVVCLLLIGIAAAGLYLTIKLIAKPLVKGLGKLVDHIKYKASDIGIIDTMDGIDFEHYLAVHFRDKGYAVTITPPEHDYGVDLILKKGKEKIAVQAKRYNFSKNYNVTYRAVQEVAAGLKYYGCNKGMVVTNSCFTKQAQELARVNNIEMWDREKLINSFRIRNTYNSETEEIF